MQTIYELMANPSFDSLSLASYLISYGEFVYSRTFAYSYAKRLRSDFPLCFVRVLKVLDCYFVITNKDDYKIYWEARKLALRNERKKKNETL